MKATRTIWKTVVFAGAMLGTAACGPKSSSPAGGTSNSGGVAEPTGELGGDTYGDPCGDDPCGDDPCGDRARGGWDEPCSGRGFVLS